MRDNILIQLCDSTARVISDKAETPLMKFEKVNAIAENTRSQTLSIPPGPEWLERFHEAYNTDTTKYKGFTIKEIYQHVSNGSNGENEDERKLTIVGNRFSIIDGFLYKIVGTLLLVVIPHSFRKELVRSHHYVFDRHQSVMSMYNSIHRRSWFPRLKELCSFIVTHCLQCGMKFTQNASFMPSTSMFRVDRPRTYWSVDHFNWNGLNILICVDMYSRWIEAKICSDTSALVTANSLLQMLIFRHGAPRSIKSDRGSSFVNEINENLFQLLGITHMTSIPLTAECNGVAERAVQILKSLLSCDSGLPNEVILQAAVYTHNTRNNKNGFSPFEVVHGEYAIDIMFNSNLHIHEEFHDIIVRIAEFRNAYDISRCIDYEEQVISQLLNQEEQGEAPSL